MDTDNKNSSELLHIDEIRLLLEEKRTSLAVMRTGIYSILVQLTILGVLIATSRFYEMIEVLHMVIVFYAVNLLLLIFSVYLIVHSFLRLRHWDRVLMQLKKQGPLSNLIDV